VVVNNGGNEDIHKACDQEGVEEIKTKNIGTNSFSHGNSINQLFKIAPNPETCGIIDHDLFLEKPIDFKSNNIIAYKQSRGDFSYFWPGFLFWKKDVPMKKIDFTPNSIGDTGANTNAIFNDLNSKINFIKEQHEDNNTIQSDGYSKFYLNDELVAIHAINGSNWHSAFSESKTKTLNDLLHNILK
tara:strand:+ start:667 stop:1224 length:558 start_codon:yes stop_codon:yes gene_type:complete